MTFLSQHVSCHAFAHAFLCALDFDSGWTLIGSTINTRTTLIGQRLVVEWVGRKVWGGWVGWEGFITSCNIYIPCKKETKGRKGTFSEILFWKFSLWSVCEAYSTRSRYAVYGTGVCVLLVVYFLRTLSRAPYRTPLACANRAAYPDPPPRSPGSRFLGTPCW